MITDLRDAYDHQLRGRAEVDAGAEVDGPVVRQLFPYRGFVSYRDLGGLRGEDLDALIERQIAYFRARGLAFEWKTRGHDEPSDLPDRLLRAGFVPEERETVLVGDAARLADPVNEPVLPTGVVIREVTADEDLDRIAAMESAVWDEDWSWLAEDLRTRRGRAPDDLVILAAEARAADAGAAEAKTTEVSAAVAGPTVVSAAWLVIKPGTDFAGLWGGSTLPPWRGRGIYRALVTLRARQAVARGVGYLQVDASDDSRPILQRLGFVAITTTTPYIWSPAE